LGSFFKTSKLVEIILLIVKINFAAERFKPKKLEEQ
jgi:hypothetical protein